MLVPPLSRCKVEDSAYDAQGKIHALGPPACSPPCFDKRLQAALMHPVQRQIDDERVEVFQVQHVAVDRCLMPMLKQILRGGLTKTPAWPHPIDGGLPDLLKPEGKIALCFLESPVPVLSQSVPYPRTCLSIRQISPRLRSPALLVRPMICLLSPTCRGVRDRKSTRLNSSHVKISYAVF